MMLNRHSPFSRPARFQNDLDDGFPTSGACSASGVAFVSSSRTLIEGCNSQTYPIFQSEVFLLCGGVGSGGALSALLTCASVSSQVRP